MVKNQTLLGRAADLAAAGTGFAAGAALLFGWRLSLESLAALALAAALWRLASCFFTAAVAHLILDLFSGPGGAGSATGFFLGAAHAEFCWTLLVPAALIARWAAPGSLTAGACLLILAWLINCGLCVQAFARECRMGRAAAAGAAFSS